MRANVEIRLFASITYGKDKETKEHRKYCGEGDFGGGGSGEFEGEEEEYEGEDQGGLDGDVIGDHTRGGEQHSTQRTRMAPGAGGVTIEAFKGSVKD